MNCRKNNKIRKRRILGVWVLALVVGLAAGGLAVGAADGTTMHLRIEGQTETLFDEEVPVGDCVARDAGGVEHSLSGVALCGLMAAAEANQFEVGLQDYGFGLFIASIGQDVTPADWSKSWSFWINDTPAAMGADAYSVVEGDEILLAFSGYPTVPLRVTAPEKVVASEQFIITVEKKIGEYDANYNWQGQWVPANTARLGVGNSEVAIDEAGQAVIEISESGTVDVWAEGDGLVRSARRQVLVEEEIQETAVPTITPSPIVTPSVSPVVSPTISPTPSPSATIEPTITPVLPSPTPAAGRLMTGEERREAARAALNYLSGRQGTDGKIEGDLVTAWSAMAFGANGQRADKVKGAGESLWDGLATAKLSSATDVERQIMAVRAAGGNLRDWQGRNLAQELRGYLAGGQTGEATIINDDIFGVLAWLAADEIVQSSEMEQTVRTVIANQDSDGAWGSIDLTAAAVQGLREYRKRGGSIDVKLAIEEARLYLRSHQDKYGGWGENLASTAWGIQAILALGEDPAGWTNVEGKAPWEALERYQNSNGGFGWRSSEDVSSFMTAYAVPALLGKSWPIVQGLAVDNESRNYETTAVGLKLVPKVAAVTSRPASPAVAGTQTSGEDQIKEEVNVLQGEETVENDSKEQKENVSGDAAALNKLIQPNRRDWQFVFSLFSLANIGIGVTVARLIIKI